MTIPPGHDINRYHVLKQLETHRTKNRRGTHFSEPVCLCLLKGNEIRINLPGDTAGYDS